MLAKLDLHSAQVVVRGPQVGVHFERSCATLERFVESPGMVEDERRVRLDDSGDRVELHRSLEMRDRFFFAIALVESDAFGVTAVGFDRRRGRDAG